MTAPVSLDVEALIAQTIANEPGSGGGVPAGPYQHDLAKAILKALDAFGAVVMAPQDIEWGECPDSWDGENQPHRVSLSLCSGCLEYDPE